MKKVLTQLNVENKRVLVRVDFNVPIKDGEILSDVRIVEGLPTINYLLSNNAKVVLCSHLGRPNGRDERLSLKPVYEHLKTLLPNRNISFCEDILSEDAVKQTKNLLGGEILVLENVRFYEGEEENSTEFVNKLAKLADYFVFDAFGTAHRKNASTYGISKKLPSAVGFLVYKELNAFNKVLNSPKKPVVAILGGAKIDDKINLTDNLLNKVNVLLIGGGMCFTFLKALRARVGKSIVNNEQIDYCFEVIKKAIEKKVEIVLPVDFVCGEELSDNAEPKVFKAGEIPDDMMGLDIGPKTIQLFSKKIKKARTLVWNGPMGAYEIKQFSTGTKMIADAVAKNKKCYSVVGGGDVVSALNQFGYSEFISHISTGGGASLKLLEGKKLCALEFAEKN